MNTHAEAIDRDVQRLPRRCHLNKFPFLWRCAQYTIPPNTLCGFMLFRIGAPKSSMANLKYLVLVGYDVGYF